MLYVLSKVYSELLAVKADPTKISRSWAYTGRERNAWLPRDSKYSSVRFERSVQSGVVVVEAKSKTVRADTPVVLLADRLYAKLHYVDETCEKTRALMNSLHGCHYSRGSSPCAHIGEELDQIVRAWGLQPDRLLAAAITAIETDIATLGYGKVHRRIEDERECVQEFLRKAGAGGEADKLGDTPFASAAVLRESVRAGEKAIDQSFGPDLDERIKVVKAQLAQLECLRDERDMLKGMGKRVRDDVTVWIPTEGLFKRAKSVW